MALLEQAHQTELKRLTLERSEALAKAASEEVQESDEPLAQLLAKMGIDDDTSLDPSQRQAVQAMQEAMRALTKSGIKRGHSQGGAADGNPAAYDKGGDAVMASAGGAAAGGASLSPPIMRPATKAKGAVPAFPPGARIGSFASTAAAKAAAVEEARLAKLAKEESDRQEEARIAEQQRQQEVPEPLADGGGSNNQDSQGEL